MKTIATVISLDKPQPGQTWRSSGDFSTLNLPAGTKNLYWKIADGTPNQESIKFDVAIDNRGNDQTVFTNVQDGMYTQVVSNGYLYIGNPRNASSEFTITVYAV
ncbi:DeoR family transcriptional regulator [Lysinibacillus xylanilyticus]|uniref:DeoR family transcriptional regulator n=1 Tax=Lysinibacillus xylanilyticus TaxID=582475 RepID=UPI00106457E7|nr:DeoR family transcriptional regulator [Lysinibacillus xylanilyticus]MED3804412.1 DeoR family transcriptional regulator [Lysinibacillus xylanilyticus]